MSFDVAADAYDRFMGRYSVLLSAQLADLAGVDGRAAGPRRRLRAGALTRELVDRLGADAVTAVDPSASFVEAVRARYPGVDVRSANAEDLPFEDDVVDVALAQLVVHFMTDPVRGISEMRRVTRPGGVVAACVWDHAGGMGPLGLFWQTARELDPTVVDESDLPGTRRATCAGCSSTPASATSPTRHSPPTSSTPTSTHGGSRSPAASDRRAPMSPGSPRTGRPELRERLRDRLPDGPFVIPAKAWAARGIA